MMDELLCGSVWSCIHGNEQYKLYIENYELCGDTSQLEWDLGILMLLL